MGNEDDAFLSFIYQCFSKLFKLIAATLYIAREMIDKANLLLKFAALTKTPTISRCTKISKPRKAGMRRVANNDLLKRVRFILKCLNKIVMHCKWPSTFFVIKLIRQTSKIITMWRGCFITHERLLICRVTFSDATGRRLCGNCVSVGVKTTIWVWVDLNFLVTVFWTHFNNYDTMLSYVWC